MCKKNISYYAYFVS